MRISLWLIGHADPRKVAVFGNPTAVAGGEPAFPRPKTAFFFDDHRSASPAAVQASDGLRRIEHSDRGQAVSPAVRL